MKQLTVQGNEFLWAGRPFRIFGGAIHYFRVLPEYWEDRLRKLKACGLNTVETYVAWNVHEPRPGEFDFSGRFDLVRFIETAAALDLKVIVRPGPYICSEWDLGGLPAWLLRDPNMQLRCSYRPYLDAVDRFFAELFRRIAPWQASRGGPIIALQVENEYAAYGNDENYLRHLVKTMKVNGIVELLFTSDHCYKPILPEVLKTANFGTKAKERFADLREFQPTGPLACMEFWAGWFVEFGKPIPRNDPGAVARELDEILNQGASFNFYMFHGGTNFGFMTGANCHEANSYDPRPTSYDFGAPLDECGNLTPLYHACRKVIARHTGQKLEEDFPPVAKLPETVVKLSESASLWEQVDALSQPVQAPNPLGMEALGQSHGYVLYRYDLAGPVNGQELRIREVRDRAWTYLDGRLVGIMHHNDPAFKLKITTEKPAARLEILIENMGRANFGANMHERKGITNGVLLNGHYLFGWTMFPLPFKTLDPLRFSPGLDARLPAFFRGTVAIDQPADTFLDLSAWTRGCVWLNGFLLGRHWNVGPHQSLYAPGPLWKKGENEIVILELEKTGPAELTFRPEPVFGLPFAETP